jgi:hypothetical protein
MMDLDEAGFGEFFPSREPAEFPAQSVTGPEILIIRASF